MVGHNVAQRKYHNVGCRERLENRYERCISQLQFWLLVSGDDGGDDSEDVDEADKGVDDGLLVSIYLRGGEGRGSVQEEGGIPLGQADSQALVQMSDLVRLFLPSVPGKC